MVAIVIAAHAAPTTARAVPRSRFTSPSAVGSDHRRSTAGGFASKRLTLESVSFLQMASCSFGRLSFNDWTRRTGSVMLAAMTIPVEKIVEAALALPSDARALLADRLAESLDPLTDEQVRAAWADEALRRRDEIASGTIAPVAAEQAFAHIRTLLK